MRRIVEGVRRFQHEIFPQKQDLFRRLAGGQAPRALLVTCGDSRLVPDLLMQTEPGELFICRNAGNIVPAYGASTDGVSATIEYAVVALGIRHLIVCGHSDCGAMKGVLYPDSLRTMPTVAAWLRHADAARHVVEALYPDRPEVEKLELLARENVLAQLANLLTHPAVAARLACGTLDVYGWYYEIATGAVLAWDGDSGRFVPLESEERVPCASPRPHWVEG
jgi:carbonic anhydrase